MSEGSERKQGVWSSVKRICEALLATAQNRVELFAVELQEEKCRLVEAILTAAAVAALGMMTLTLATFTLVMLFWEKGRVAALIVLSVLYLVGTLLAWRSLKARLNSRNAFSSTIAELKKDRSCLNDRN
jgi:uncharacterized membrane protein YqjE